MWKIVLGNFCLHIDLVCFLFFFLFLLLVFFFFLSIFSFSSFFFFLWHNFKTAFMFLNSKANGQSVVLCSFLHHLCIF